METPFGTRIKELRELRGLTQEKLAELCGVSTSCISRWERGSLRPRPDKYPLLAKALDVSENDFFVSPQIPLPDDVILREILSLLGTMDYQEKQYFLEGLKLFLSWKSKKSS